MATSVVSSVVASVVAFFALGLFLAAASYNEQLDSVLTETQAATRGTDAALQRLKEARDATLVALDDVKTEQPRTTVAFAVAEEANPNEQRSDYYRRMALAKAEYDDGNAAAVAPLLNGCLARTVDGNGAISPSLDIRTA